MNNNNNQAIDSNRISSSSEENNGGSSGDQYNRSSTSGSGEETTSGSGGQSSCHSEETDESGGSGTDTTPSGRDDKQRGRHNNNESSVSNGERNSSSEVSEDEEEDMEGTSSDDTNANKTEETPSSTTAKPSSYQDFSHLAPLPAKESNHANAHANKEPTFPVKLHMILSNKEYEDIITWLPHGRSWRILHQKLFEEKVIPQYFRHGRYASFARQVNGWGFKRVVTGCDSNSYFHPLFLRGIPHLCERIRRWSPKENAEHRKQQEDERRERPPDFYAMTRKHPLPESAPVPASTIAAVQAAIRLPPAFASSSAAASGSDGNGLTEWNGLAVLEERRKKLLDSRNESSGPSSRHGSGPDLASLQLHGGAASSSAQQTSTAQMRTQLQVANQTQMMQANYSMAGPQHTQNAVFASTNGGSAPNSQQDLMTTLGQLQEQKAAAPPPAPDRLQTLQKIISMSERLPNGLDSLLDVVEMLVQAYEQVPAQAPAQATPFQAPQAAPQQQNAGNGMFSAVPAPATSMATNNSNFSVFTAPRSNMGGMGNQQHAAAVPQHQQQKHPMQVDSQRHQNSLSSQQLQMIEQQIILHSASAGRGNGDQAGGMAATQQQTSSAANSDVNSLTPQQAGDVLAALISSYRANN